MENTAHTVNKDNKDNKSEFYLSLFVIATLAYNLVTETVNMVVNLVLPRTPIDTAICLAVYLFLLYKALPSLLPRIRLVDILVLLVSLIVFGVAMLNDDTAQYSIALLPTFIIQMFPLYILGRTACDIEEIERIFYKSVPIIVGVAVVNIYFTVFATEKTQVVDNMSFAYYLLPFSLMALFALLNKFSILNGSIFLVSFILQVLSGTRGPLLCIALAALLYVAFSKISIKVKLFIGALFCLLIIFFLSDMFMESMMELSELLDEMGISNRILDKFLEDDIADSSGRDSLTESIISAIGESPLFGKGFLSDRVILDGAYVHNIFYELICHYGIIIGVIAFCVILVVNLRMLIKHKEHTAWVVMLVSAGLIKLFMSSSYVQEPMFFLMIGYGFNNVIKDEKKNI